MPADRWLTVWPTDPSPGDTPSVLVLHPQKLSDKMKKLLTTLALALGISLAASADSAPAFPGGDAALQTYLSENMKYPKAASDNGIEGVVNVEFAVLPDGTIGQIKIVRMLDPDLEQEAIRLVKSMPTWTPAEKGGKPVEQTVTLPVKFTLPDE